MNKTTGRQSASEYTDDQDNSLSSTPQFLFPYLERGQDLLDYGCGTGIATLELADVLFPGHVTGIDVHDTRGAEQLAFGRELVNARFHTGNGYQLPFQNETFDIIYSHDLLEILEHPITALKELCRVLRSGGILAISYAQQASSTWQQQNIANGAPLTPSTILNVWMTAMDLTILEAASWKPPFPRTSQHGSAILISESPASCGLANCLSRIYSVARKS
ncbi:MAG: hypothetical protein C5B47_02555 [Verrucomicrobia bacterium]|nr:MAG: hypothetical protein C5B47_02555 [Verrucomicrobiota bacterium]